MPPRKQKTNHGLGLPSHNDRFSEDNLRRPGALDETAVWVLERVRVASSPQSATVLRDLAKAPSACALILASTFIIC